RTAGVSADDVEHALYEERSLVKQIAMRRTLFVFPRDLLPAALGSAAARVAAEQRRLITRDVERHDVAEDGAAWLEAATRAVLAHLAGSGPLSARELREQLGDLLTHLAGSGPLSARELREQVPELTGTFTVSPEKRYGGTFQIAPRVLTVLGAEGRITRGRNAGHWRLGRPTWTLTEAWLGERPEPLGPEEGYAEIVRRWLRTFGPGTLEDIQWWLGSTKTAVRAALAAVDAVEVGLDGGRTGWVLPDDL